MTPQDTIAGRYEIGERLGVGGMSTVHLAFDGRLERHVAIKLLAEHLADDQQFVSRFRREALAAARLVHPNIVQVFDFGLEEGATRRHQGRSYIVMELIRGRSGAEILRERGRLTVDEALGIVLPACRGLDYAHRHGVVHRDVKPGNLLRSDDGVVKLADFGIAKAISDESSITQVGSVIGTASYLAPEQAAGEDAGPQADIYALGVVTYQLLSGRLPYEATSLTELALKQQREAPPWLHELDPKIGEPIAKVVDRALALDPRDRWPDAESFRKALEQAAKGVTPAGAETQATRVVGDDATAATRMMGRDAEATAIAPRAGAAAGAAAAGAAAGGIVARQPRAPRPGATGSAPPVVVPPPSRDRVPERRGGARRARRAFGIALVLLMIVGGTVAAVVSTSNSDKALTIRNEFSDKATSIVDELQTLLDKNSQ